MTINIATDNSWVFFIVGALIGYVLGLLFYKPQTSKGKYGVTEITSADLAKVMRKGK
jgi:hypothetical protein